MLHRSLDGVPASDGIVAVHHLAWNTERLAAINDPLFAVLRAGGSGDAPRVVGHDHEHRQLVARPRAPDETGGEITLGGAGLAAGDNRDAVTTQALLDQRGAGSHDVLNLNHRADRCDIPLTTGEVAREIPAHGMRIGAGHAHLADAVAERHAHGNQGGTVAIVEVEEVVFRPAALVDLQAEASVERLLARAADPEVPLSRLAHLDHPLFHGAGAHHDAVDLEATPCLQGFAPR